MIHSNGISFSWYIEWSEIFNIPADHAIERKAVIDLVSKFISCGYLFLYAFLFYPSCSDGEN